MRDCPGAGQDSGEQSLRLEELAQWQGKFPQSVSDEPLPETRAAGKPSVKLSARTTRAKLHKRKNLANLPLICWPKTRLELMAYPVKTDIWIQLGAFHNEEMPAMCWANLTDLEKGKVMPVLVDGRTLYRARVGLSRL